MANLSKKRINQTFPGAFDNLQGYDDLQSYLGGSFFQQSLIIVFILIACTFNLLLLLLGNDISYFLMMFGFLSRDYALALGMTFAVREHYLFWNRHPDIFESLAVTPIPKEVVPSLIRSSLLKKSFYILTVSMFVEVLLYGIITLRNLDRYGPELYLLIYYCLMLPFLMVFHYHTTHLVTSVFMRQTLQSSNYFSSFMKGIAYLTFITGTYTFLGIVLTITLGAISGSIANAFTGGYYGAGPEMVYVIAGFVTMAPIFLLCTYLKYIASRQHTTQFIGKLTHHIHG